MNSIRLTALTLLVVGSRLEAQGASADALCNASDQAVEHVALPSTNDTTWFRWYTLAGCGNQGARAAAAALRTSQLRGETDQAKLSQWFILFGGIRSKLLLDSFQDAAEDNGASVPVRLFAIEAMTGYLSPATTYDRDALGAATDQNRCVPSPRNEVKSGSVNDLPNDVFGRVLNSVRRVANKAAATPTVRQLANCWVRKLDLKAPVSTGQIQLSYVCGLKFKVHNGNTAVVKVRYSVLQTAEARDLEVLGGEDYFFFPLNAGTMQLSYNGQVLSAKANTNKACP